MGERRDSGVERSSVQIQGVDRGEKRQIGLKPFVVVGVTEGGLEGKRPGRRPRISMLEEVKEVIFFFGNEA